MRHFLTLVLALTGTFAWADFPTDPPECDEGHFPYYDDQLTASGAGGTEAMCLQDAEDAMDDDLDIYSDFCSGIGGYMRTGNFYEYAYDMGTQGIPEWYCDQWIDVVCCETEEGFIEF